MHDSIGGDLLRGARQIARFIGLSTRNTFFKLEQGHIPAAREGHIWVASKSALRRHYGVALNNTPPDTNSDTTDHAAAPPPREARAARSGHSAPRSAARTARR